MTEDERDKMDADIASLGSTVLDTIGEWHKKHRPFGKEDLNAYYVACAMGDLWTAIVGALPPRTVDACMAAFVERVRFGEGIKSATQADDRGHRN